MAKSDVEILNSIKGSLNRHVSDEELHEVRQKVFDEYVRRDELL